MKGITIGAGLAAAALASAACGSSASTTTTQAASQPSQPAAIQPSYVSAGLQGEICTDIEAMVIAGNSPDPADAAASVTRTTINQVYYAINNHCPSMESVETGS